jgi:cellulose synthase/poly-beta-1,6-N-acetylglucosamine synthase-like glycosyltransferase
MSAASPTLSVVVIGRNEGVRLERCLISVRAIRDWQGGVEIIYVDSGSSDDSCPLARSLGCRVIELNSDRPSAALGRNAGWRSAAAPLILFLDGDTILDPEFPGRAAAALNDPHTAVICGRRREIHADASVYNRVLDLDWIGPSGFCDYCGGDALIRRDVLETVGGYDDTLIAGEEPDMCRRMRALGYKILHLDCPMTDHDLAMHHWHQYWRRAVRTGHAYAEVSGRYAGSELPLWESESRSNIKGGVFWASAWLLAFAACVWLRSPLPFVAVLALFGALAVRTARKFGWKSSDSRTLFLYGVHSHLQQLPILVGQLSYWWSRKHARRKRLIEYKERAI